MDTIFNLFSYWSSSPLEEPKEEKKEEVKLFGIGRKHKKARKRERLNQEKLISQNYINAVQNAETNAVGNTKV